MIMRLIVAVFTDAAQAATDGMSVVSVGGRAGICFFRGPPCIGSRIMIYFALPF